jgi:NAD(P)H-flavin reductase
MTGAVEPMLPTPLEITRAYAETADTFTLEFDAAALPSGGRFAPGQFHMLYAFGIGEVPISISGDPETPARLVHTIRAVGPVTQAMQAMQPGDVLGVRGPYGRAWPVEAMRGRDVLLLAGGLGLAPLRPAIYHLIRHRAGYGRVAVLYGARTPGDLVFRAELERWRDAGLDVFVTVDRAGADWAGPVGVVTALLGRAAFDPATAVALLCGPEVMMRFAARDLAALGISPARIYVSLERNMKCAVARCGHCQILHTFVCREGPVYRYDIAAPLLRHREL